MRLRVFVFLIFCYLIQSASATIRGGNSLYEKGDYPGALREYMEVRNHMEVRNQARGAPADSDLVRFNMGTAFYKNQQYKEALQEFAPLLDSSRTDLDTSIQKQAFYNAANSYFRLGDYQKALDAVNGALALDTAYAKAKQNKEIIEKYLQRQQENQQQNQNSSSSGASSSSGSSSSQSSGSSSNSSESSSHSSSASSSGSSSGSSSNSASGSSSDSRGSSSASMEMSREQAEQMLRDFQEKQGERKPWRGKRPEKDW
jgi:tetratricopeptide (TPR) repeat protein